MGARPELWETADCIVPRSPATKDLADATQTQLTHGRTSALQATRRAEVRVSYQILWASHGSPHNCREKLRELGLSLPVWDSAVNLCTDPGHRPSDAPCRDGG